MPEFDLKSRCDDKQEGLRGMKFVGSIAATLVLGAVLGGCSTSGLLNSFRGGSTPPPTPVVQTGNNLAMPPDLQLRPPSNAVSENYQPNTMAAPIPAAPAAASPLYGEPNAAVASAAPAPRAPAQDIYAQYGISKLKPDGTPKAAADLQRELQVAIIKRKQQQNPNYGTIKNIGNIFSDG